MLHPMARRKSVLDDALPYDEEFLFHLSRGSEFLIANRVVEAKDELERALLFQPRDAKGQDLLAGVYFRLGVYPRAIELWQDLVRVHPEDVALRVNLGLALLKTAQLDEAIKHLQRAVTLDDEHGRAWGYLGLAMWRDGRIDKAREAFVRGGQASMARRMEEMLGMTSGSMSPPPSLEFELEPADVFATNVPRPARTPAEFGHAVLSGDVATRSGLTQHDALRPSMAPGRALSKWPGPVRELEGMSLQDGVLTLAPVKVAMRVDRTKAAAWCGRDADASTSTEPGSMMRIDIGERALVLPAPSKVIEVMTLEEDRYVYVLATCLVAHEMNLTGEVRPVRIGANTVDVVQLRGRGMIAIMAPRRPASMTVTAGDPIHVRASMLVGWSGRLFPATTNDETVTLSGEGTIFVA